MGVVNDRVASASGGRPRVASLPTVPSPAGRNFLPAARARGRGAASTEVFPRTPVAKQLPLLSARSRRPVCGHHRWWGSHAPPPLRRWWCGCRPPPRARTPLGADVYQARQPPERPSGQMAPAVTSGGTPKAPTPRAVAKAAVAQRVRGGFHCHGTLASRSSPPHCHGRVPLLDSHRQSTHKQRWVPTTAGTTAFVHSGCLPGSQTPPGKAHSPTAPPARGTDQASGGQW